MAEATTFEEAKHCPRCKKPGKETKTTRQYSRESRQTVEMHYIECVTELCSWFGTCWIVQTNEDGSLPNPESTSSLLRKKQYPALTPGEESEIISRIEQNLGQQLNAETNMQGHGEVRNPNS